MSHVHYGLTCIVYVHMYIIAKSASAPVHPNYVPHVGARVHTQARVCIYGTARTRVEWDRMVLRMQYVLQALLVVDLHVELHIRNAM